MGAKPMPAQLLALSDGPTILLDKPILLFGRHPECDVQLNSRKVSRRHCCVAQIGNYLVVRDLGSTNGVRINGIRVIEGKLDPGDELTVGSFRYRVCWDSQVQSRPSVSGSSSSNGNHRRPFEDMDIEDAEEPIELQDDLPPGAKPLRGVPIEDDIILPDDLSLLPEKDKDT